MTDNVVTLPVVRIERWDAEPPTLELLRRLQLAQDDCAQQGQMAAAILLQDARAEIIRLGAAISNGEH